MFFSSQTETLGHDDLKRSYFSICNLTPSLVTVEVGHISSLLHDYLYYLFSSTLFLQSGYRKIYWIFQPLIDSSAMSNYLMKQHFHWDSFCSLDIQKLLPSPYILLAIAFPSHPFFFPYQFSWFHNFSLPLSTFLFSLYCFLIVIHALSSHMHLVVFKPSFLTSHF